MSAWPGKILQAALDEMLDEAFGTDRDSARYTIKYQRANGRYTPDALWDKAGWKPTFLDKQRNRRAEKRINDLGVGTEEEED